MVICGCHTCTLKLCWINCKLVHDGNHVQLVSCLKVGPGPNATYCRNTDSCSASMRFMFQFSCNLTICVSKPFATARFFHPHNPKYFFSFSCTNLNISVMVSKVNGFTTATVKGTSADHFNAFFTLVCGFLQPLTPLGSMCRCCGKHMWRLCPSLS